MKYGMPSVSRSPAIPLRATTPTQAASLLWGAVDSAYLVSGWRQKALRPLLGGSAMIAVSYRVEAWWLRSLISVAIIGAIWWLFRRGWF